MFQCLYTGEPPRSSEETELLRKAASKYKVHNVVEMCVTIHALELAHGRAFEIYRHALEQGNTEEAEGALNIICL